MSPLRGGIDLGGTKVQAAVLDDEGSVLGSAREATPTRGTPADVAAVMIAKLTEAAAQAGVEPRSLATVGVGSPGAVDAATGTVTGAGNLPGWGGSYELGQTLADAFDAPVLVGNDVDAATYAEFLQGAGQPFKSLLGVFWGTGVGGGVVLDGKPWNGRGAAGEIGHVVVRIGGARCGCGRRGCMEAYAGRASMERRARRRARKGVHTELFRIMKKRGSTRLTSGVWVKAVERGDPLAVELMEDAISALGAAIASSVNLLDVEAVVIGGGLGLRLGAPYLERVQDAMLANTFARHRPPAIVLAELGDLGGAVGAARLAAEQLPARRTRRRSTAQAAPA
jgi:glucokinase